MRRSFVPVKPSVGIHVSEEAVWAGALNKPAVFASRSVPISDATVPADEHPELTIADRGISIPAEHAGRPDSGPGDTILRVLIDASFAASVRACPVEFGCPVVKSVPGIFAVSRAPDAPGEGIRAWG